MECGRALARHPEHPVLRQPAGACRSARRAVRAPVQMWHRSLARGTRATNSRVALEGVGGDQLFQVSEVYLADLLRTGRARRARARVEVEGDVGLGLPEFLSLGDSAEPSASRARGCAADARRAAARLVSRALAPAVDRYTLRSSAFARGSRSSPRPSHHARITCRSRNSLVSVAPVFPSRVRRGVDVREG